MRIRTSGLLFFSLALIGLVFVSHPTSARADGIEVNPPKFDVFGLPGDTITDVIKVTSQAETQVTYQAFVEDFTPQGDEGGVNLVDDPEAPITSISLARWTTTEPSRFTLEPGQEKDVKFTIKIPKSGEPGGKYATIIIRRAGDAIQGGAIVNSQVGTLILLRVSGNVTEKLNLDQFKTSDSYYQHGPVTFNLHTTNTGNVHVAPSGTIIITNIFGKKVREIPLTQANVLPTSGRVVHTVWDQSTMVGRYTASLVASYGQTKQQLVATTTFTVLPLYLVWALIAVVVFILLLITQRRRIKRLINKITSD